MKYNTLITYFYRCSVIFKCSPFQPSLFKMKVKTLKRGLRWLDGVFQGQYLPSLSINYVSNKKDGKITTTEDFLKVLYYYYFFGWLTRGRLVASRQPQLYQVKMKISCYDQGCNDIGVVTATKRRYFLFYLQQYISALGTVLSKSFTVAFSSNSGLDVRQV